MAQPETELAERVRKREGVQNGGSESAPRPALNPQSSVQTCSICLEAPQYPVETNCGHLFCARCILTHWNHERHPQACHCPMCRREVTLLIPAEDLPTQNSELYSQVAAYNQQMCDSQGGLISRLRDLPVLLSHLRQDFLRLRGGLPICSKLHLLVLAVVLVFYLLSPIDLIPEMIFGIFGLIDDFVAIVYMLLYAAGMYRAFVANQDRPRQQ